MGELRILKLALAVIGLGSTMAIAQEPASTFPSRPVTLILATAAGGPNDFEVRLYATKLSAMLGQPFVLDFKVGAGGTLGSAYVAKAKPDGYTLLVVSANFSASAVLYKSLPFDTVKDFAPISLMSRRPTVLVVPSAFPARTLAEYLAYAKGNPGKVNFGTTGAGSIQHLLGGWLSSATGTRTTLIHYKGTAPLNLDLIAGRLDVSPVGLLSALPLIQSGKLRALAILEDKRSTLLPDLPTMAEAGIPGLDGVLWLGIVAPGATAPGIVNKLSEVFAGVARAPDVAARLTAEGSVLVGSTAEQFRQVLGVEIARWQKVARDTGISLDE